MDYDDAFSRQDDLLHSTVLATTTGSILGPSKLGASVHTGRPVFRGTIEVTQANNGYILRIGTHDGREADVYIAQDVTEVNKLIAAAMVSFKLEQ